MNYGGVLTKVEGFENSCLSVDSHFSSDCSDNTSPAKELEMSTCEQLLGKNAGIHRPVRTEESTIAEMEKPLPVSKTCSVNVEKSSSLNVPIQQKDTFHKTGSHDHEDCTMGKGLQEHQHNSKSCCTTFCNEYCFSCLSPVLAQRQDPLHSLPVVRTFCPPQGSCAHGFVIVLLIVILWGVLWSIMGDIALPGGHLFALLVLEVTCVTGGYIAALFKLPPLLGMLIIGFTLRNVPYVNIATDLRPDWSSALRNIALTVILIRAGLGLDPKALRRLSVVCLRLAFIPCLLECVTVACFCHILLDFPLVWGFILGFVLAAVSPAVVVPSMLNLQERGLGVAKGIPTLVIAASSIDDVLAIGGFGVAVSITFSSGNIIMTILQGPIEIMIGLLYGAVFGILLWYLPEKKSKNATELRLLLLFGTGLFAVFGSRSAGFAGSGALGCLCVSFVAALKWRKEESNHMDAISNYFAVLWLIFQPLLFGLIGSEITVDSLKGDIVGLGIATLFCGLVVRILASTFAVLGAGLNLKERIFISIAWLPKATVQAAIGPVALDYARTNEAGAEAVANGVKVLTLAVLSILITAPLGAAAMALTGPKLLSEDTPENIEDGIETEAKESTINCDQTNL